MENIHSKNNKANTLIYIIGMSCFTNNQDMTRLKTAGKPDFLKGANPAYVVKKNGEILHYIGFYDKTETMSFYDKDGNVLDSVSYDAALFYFTKK